MGLNYNRILLLDTKEFLPKQTLRIELKKQRESLDNITVRNLSNHIIANIQKLLIDLNLLIIHNNHFFSYSPYNNEVDLNALNELIIKSCGCVYLPVMNENSIEFYKQKNLDNFTKNKYGIKEPCKTEQFSKIEFEQLKNRIVMLCPGIAFDKKMRRLGFGMGCYDSYLKKYAPENFIKIGVAYSFALVDTLPRGEYDIDMDYVVTEKEIWNSSGKLYTT